MYSDEYNAFDVTLSEYPHLTTVRIEPATVGITSSMLCQLSYEAKSVRVCSISELSLAPSMPMCSMIMIFFLACFVVLM